MLKKLTSAILSLFFTICLLTCSAISANAASTKTLNQDASAQPATSESDPRSANSIQKSAKTDSGKTGQNKAQGGVVAKGVYSSGSSSKPYSPFATNLSADPTPGPSMPQGSIPSTFGEGWTSEVLTFAANNLLNTSDPANAQEPSVTPEAVISYLEGQKIEIATSAKTQITTEINNIIDNYNNRLGLIDGAPLTRIFAIQIICMKNTSTGQLVYPAAFPTSMLDKSYSSEYQSSWDSATQGKSYVLNATYIWNSISYTTQDAIWVDPAITTNASEAESGVYSLNQIEQEHLKSMTPQAGKINSFNIIGITHRAYIIKTNPPSMSITNGYEESTGTGTSGQTVGGMTAQSVVKPGSSTSMTFTMETGPSSTSGYSATISLSGASNAQFDISDFSGHITGNPNPFLPSILKEYFDISSGDGGRTATLRYIGKEGLKALSSYTFSLGINVTNAPSNMAEACAVTQGSITSGDLKLQGNSYTWCFAVASISQKPASPATLYPPTSSSPNPTSTITMEVPGWAFQYNGNVVNTLWSTLNGKDTSLSDYEAFQENSPKLDEYSVNANEVTVKDLTTGANVTSLFSSNYSSTPPSNTGIPYSGPQNYGGWTLTPPSLTVSWNNEWTGSAVSDPNLWGYGNTPIGYDMFEVTFPVTLSSSVGGNIYTQSSTAGPATTFSSEVYTISTPLSAPALSPISLTAAGIKGSNGTVESSSATATLGVPMSFEAQANFPTAGQIASMQANSYSLVFYSYDADSSSSLKGASVNGIELSSLPVVISQSQNGAVAILLTPQDFTYISEHAAAHSKLLIDYDWSVSSAPSHATSEIGYVKGTSLSLSAPNYVPQFVSTSASLTLTVNSNGTGPLSGAPNASQPSSVTGIWFQNRLLSGGDAQGAKFSVQNAAGQYLTPSSEGNPPYSYSSTPYYFSSSNGKGLFRMWGLADGTYTVTETKLPEGASGPMPSFKVTLNYASNKPSSIFDPSSSSLVNGSAYVVYNEVAASYSLPLAGGKFRILFLCVILPLLFVLAGFAAYRIYRARR